MHVNDKYQQEEEEEARSILLHKRALQERKSESKIDHSVFL